VWFSLAASKEKTANCTQLSHLSFYLVMFFLYIYKFIYFNWRLITLQYCIGFAIHQHESATGVHVFPILHPPPLPPPSPYHFGSNHMCVQNMTSPTPHQPLSTLFYPNHNSPQYPGLGRTQKVGVIITPYQPVDSIFMWSIPKLHCYLSINSGKWEWVASSSEQFIYQLESHCVEKLSNFYSNVTLLIYRGFETRAILLAFLLFCH